MRFLALLLTGLPLALPLGGCLSGQTGSPDCVPPENCVCDPLLSAGSLLRVHVESADQERMVATVDAVFWTIYSDYDPVAVGDRIGGALLRLRPCDGPSAPPPAAESDLLVLYGGGYLNCDANLACAESECSTLKEPELSECWTACDAKTQQTCTDQRNAELLDGVFSLAVPWTEPLQFGDGHELPQQELEVLETPETCELRFPGEPAPPCNDVQVGPCTVTPANAAGTAGSAQPALAWLSLVGLLVLLRRARSSRSR